MPEAPNPSRRDFLAVTTGALASMSLAAAGAAPAFALEEATLSSLAERMRSGELTSEAITAAYLERIDAIVAPTTSPPWMIDPVTGDSGRGGCASLPAVAGYPHLTVPAGFIKPAAPFEGVAPVGISFFGPAFSDAKLLAIGRVFEQATKHRRAAPV